MLCIALMMQSIGAQVQFQSLRYNENYAHLRNDTAAGWYSKMKFRKLNASGSAFLSQGGEVRYQYQHFTNEDWGESPVESYNSFYTRFLYHADWHLQPHFRLFMQLNSTFAVGRVTGNRSIDQNVLDLQQVFFDVTASKSLLLRVGRQELLYGSQRLIAVREGPNNRQSYDAAKLIFQKNNVQLDVFYSHPVRVRQEIFDDKFNEAEKLWSAYAVVKQVPALHNIDLYYIGYYSQQKRYAAGAAKEVRHSLGTRIWKKTGRWNYDFEALYQFGNWGHQSISAYTASIDLNYMFAGGRWQPAINLKTEVISGDKKTAGNRLNTFNPLFPRGAYFGLAALIGPSNLVDLHPAFSIRPGNNIQLSADYDVFWRHSKADGIYGPNAAMIFDSDSDDRFIGHQLGVAAEYEPSRFLKLSPEMMWFFPGPYLKDVSRGKQVFFAAFTAQFKF
jgi:hypothetical protein